MDDGTRSVGAHVLLFCSDLNEASQQKMIGGFLAAGHRVTTASFKRRNMPEASPAWRDIDLGTLGNGVGLRRLWRLAGSLAKVARLSRSAGSFDHIVARDLDMALLALWGRVWSSGRPPVVYVSLDVHGVLSRGGIIGWLARWVERRVLSGATALVVSSPGFLRAHFEARQGYTGEVRLLENRVLWPDVAPPRVTTPQEGVPVLGWVGALRCPRSFALLAEAARRAGDELRVELHGAVHYHQLPNFDRTVASTPALTWHGAYKYPQDLGRIYGRLSCVWGQDLWQSGANSDWLLPNRIYEAGYFGCPILAVAGTETGRRVAQDGSGVVLEHAQVDAILAALRDRDTLALARRRVQRLPAQRFSQTSAQMAACVLGAPMHEVAPAVRAIG